MIYALFGLVLLGFGALSLLMRDPAVTLLQVVPGVLLLIYAGVAHLGEIRERLSTRGAQRGAWFGSNALLQTLALVVLLGFAGYLAQRYPLRWDFTESGLYTLTEGSRQVLEQIPEGEGVEIYAFFTAADPVRELLEQYAYASDRLSHRIIDPNEQPLLAARFEIFNDGVLVVCKGPCAQATSTVRTDERTEAELTESIRRVISQRRKVYFVSGHDERDPAGTGNDGLSAAAGLLGGENIAYDTLLLAQTERVPEDADAVVIAAPSFTFFERELAALDAYLRGGGRALILADALQKVGLEELLQDHGVALGENVVVDQRIELLQGSQLSLQPVLSDYGDHPITREMRGRFTIFQLARTVEPAADTGADGTRVLLRTSPQSWAVRSDRLSPEGEVTLDPEQDRPGPLSLGVARTIPAPGTGVGSGPDAEAPAREGRLVVIGDADFASNRYLAEAANTDLFLNTINWLVGEEEFITIERKQPRASRVDLSGGRFQTFSYLGILFVPEAILLLGLWNWWRRRRS